MTDLADRLYRIGVKLAVESSVAREFRVGLTYMPSGLELVERCRILRGKDERFMKLLTAVPVFNEARYIEAVLAETWRFSSEILVVNDGSTDATAEILAGLPEAAAHRFTDHSSTKADPPQKRILHVITHDKNRGYGAALKSAFEYAKQHCFDVLVTMDCDGQHEPSRIPVLLEAIHNADIVSGSRYLRDFHQDSQPPHDRFQINRVITEELNQRFGLALTDAFCGFKAYRRSALGRLQITEMGWGMPLQLWVQAVRWGLRIKEVGVPRLYLDPTRAFGGVMDQAEARLAYYRQVINNAARTEIRPATIHANCPTGAPQSEESCR